jgi:hypothetical protein
VAPVAQGPGAGDLPSPVDRAVGQGVQQQVTQVATVHLRPTTCAVVAEQAHGLTALVDDLEEVVVQTGGVQGFLPVLRVDVEHPALRTGLCLLKMSSVQVRRHVRIR